MGARQRCNTRMAADVFISYARSPSLSQARALRDCLVTDGVSVFHDERSIEYGSAFPHDLARGLEEARVVVLLLDPGYFARPWCTHEFNVSTAAYRSDARDASLDHLIVALPSDGDPASVLAQLPPPLAARSWPTVDDSTALTALVRERLATPLGRLSQTLATVNDDAVERLRTGGDIALPWPAVRRDEALALAPPLMLLDMMPRSRENEFVGHASELWQVVHALVTQRAFGAPRSCAVQGPGGSGKSQLASELVARYGQRFFPGGIVWTSAEGDGASLLAQWRAAWQLIAPGKPDPSAGAGEDTTTARSLLAAALRSKLGEDGRREALLWVVDGLPEAGAGGGVDPRAWCPALGLANVLITTRRARLEAMQSHVAVGALAPASALALLTRPPVDVRWLPAEDWSLLVEWVGGLPLALTILQASLADGHTTAQALKVARLGEASIALDREMDTLRDEVGDPRLRGVAQSFAFSFKVLGERSALQRACRVVALLSGVPIAETLLAQLIEPALVGRLAKRSWITPVGAHRQGTGVRHWVMHRVPASFLRVHGGDIDPVFAALFKALRAIDAEALPGTELNALGWQFVHVRKQFDRRRADGAPLPAAIDAARAFVVEAAGTPAGPDSRGWRYLAAGLASALDTDDAVVERLVAALPTADEETVAAIPQVMQPLKGAPAVALMKRLLDDDRPLVRARAIVHAASLMDLDLAEPLLQRMLEWPNENLKTSFDVFLDAKCPDLRRLLSVLLRAANDKSQPTRRQRAVELLGRALAINGSDLEVGGYNRGNIAVTLACIALDDLDEGVAQAALDGASVHFEPAVQMMLVRALATADDVDTLCRVVRCWGDYLARTRRPPMPRLEQVDYEEGGGLRIEFGDVGAAGSLPADAYGPLIDVTAGEEERCAGIAARAVLRTREGVFAVGQAANGALESREFDRVARLAERLIGADVKFVNAWWWRAQARNELGDLDGTLADLSRVEALTPEFAPAFALHGDILARRGEFAEAIAPLERASILEPQDPYRQQVLWYALYALSRFAEAQSTAQRAIECAPALSESWYERGIARAALGRLDDAIADLMHAIELEPGHTRAHEALVKFEAAQLHANGDPP